MQGSFFIFDVFIFWGVRGVKGQKIAKDDKKILSVELHISGTIYHMILINGHMCKRIISPGVFFYTFFPNFNFWGQQWRKRAKDGLKWQKNYVYASTPFHSKHLSYDRVFCSTTLT